ncbi:MAG TPA: class I SAM-dependent methyltransferase [Tepidisphaeraceae bacterium]
MAENEGEIAKGSEDVKSFYDSHGWKIGKSGDRTLDLELFGNWEVGELRQRAHSHRIARIREAYASLGTGFNLVECGCGGNPAVFLSDLCSTYTGVDFSTTGLDATSEKLAPMGSRVKVVAADLCSMPFSDGEFDAAYSAHALYHIPSPEAQGKAFDEVMRIVRPGGVAVFVMANPRPLLFPGRLVKRLIADTPVVGGIVDRLRSRPPLPYNPMTLGWMRKRLERTADVEVISYAMASIWFDHHVSERKPWGRTLWRSVAWLERYHEKAAAYLGNFVTIRAVRRARST